MNHSRQSVWLLILPIIAWFYIGLFVTMWLWYPDGLNILVWREHLLHFSIVYLFWLVVFFIYTLFDLTTFRFSTTIISRLLGATIFSLIIAVLYFYFQPELILTPRRFLLVHTFISTLGIGGWYAFVQYLLPRIWQRQVLLHPILYQLNLHPTIISLCQNSNFMGWNYIGQFDTRSVVYTEKHIIVLPSAHHLSTIDLQELFALKGTGVEFIEYSKLYELSKRAVHLGGLNELWFLHSVVYSRKFYDIIKRLLDVVIGLFGTIIFIFFIPLLILLIKLDSSGSFLFIQERVGRFGKPFHLYKLRTMNGEITNTWTTDGDQRVTRVGAWLRKMRLDELPQFINILLGDMSLVGPRPEQVNIVKQLQLHIPYYNERHMVKPGLSGWSQLHLYANSIEGTEVKLQYDFYYIKHRSLLFDLEIILRTIFHVLTMRGQ